MNIVAAVVEWEGRVVKEVGVANGNACWTAWKVRSGQVQEQPSEQR